MSDPSPAAPASLPASKLRKLDRQAAEILEEPMIRVSYELMRRNHRAAQRQVERDFTYLSATLKEPLKPITNVEQHSGATGETAISPKEAKRLAALAKVKLARERVKMLRRKLESLQPSSSRSGPSSSPIPPSHQLKSRLSVLSSLASPDLHAIPDASPPATWTSWSSTRTDRFVVEYLLRTGRFITARAFAKERGIEALVDVGLFEECERIEKALQDGKSCTEALGWCGENRGTLKKIGSDLEFLLRLQEYIELCRRRDIPAALAYMKRFIAPWADAHMKEVQHAAVLLAFGELTDVKEYRLAYSSTRWQDLGRQFRDTFFTVYGVPSQPLLSLTAAAGLSSLKLAACLPTHPHESSEAMQSGQREKPSGNGVREYLSEETNSEHIPSIAASPPIHIGLDPSLASAADPTPIHGHPEHPQRNVDCPTCSREMSDLAKEVPFSHHVNSTIVCRISGEVMDDENYPMVFPNGYVYSYKALSAVADGAYRVVTCPRTGESCTFDRLRKVFIA